MTLPFLDLTAPGFATVSDDVHAARDASWCARTPFGYAVLRHRQAGMILRDRRFRQGSHGWPDMVGLTGAFADFWRRSIISKEGPDHKDLRRIAQAALSEESILALEPAFETAAERLCDTLDPNGFDMVADVTEPFAGLAIALLLGLPEADAPELAHDASRLGLAMGPDAKAYEAVANGACERLAAMAGGLLDDPPLGCFVARLNAAAGSTERQELIDLVVISIFGGVDTTRAQLAFAAWLFAQHPKQWDWLRDNPDAVPQAIDEVIRMRPTTTWASREALEDVEMGGVSIRAGETVHVLVHAIYVLEPAVLRYLEPGKHVDMPAVVRAVVEDRRRANAFPLREAWIDVGRDEDLQRAEARYRAEGT